jgi:hypothetical protein
MHQTLGLCALDHFTKEARIEDLVAWCTKPPSPMATLGQHATPMID